MEIVFNILPVEDDLDVSCESDGLLTESGMCVSSALKKL